MSGFLSQENAQYITTFLGKFLQDKFQFTLFPTIPDTEYRKLLGETMRNTYAQHKHQYTVVDLNKMTISEMKEFIKQKYITPKPIPEASTPIMEDMNISEDSDFFNKLQKLELQRKTFQPTGMNPTALSTLAPAETLLPSTVSSQVPAQITTVYMPTPPKIGKEVKIHSWQRDWLQYPMRNGFIWKGSFPKQTDRTNTRLGCLIGPNSLLASTHMLSLVIEGANEDMVSVSLIPDHSVGEYTMYRPILESLSYVRLLALPWKITLEAGDGEELLLGIDNIPYTVVNTYEQTTMIAVKNAGSICRVGEGLRIYMEESKKLLPSQVVSIKDDTIEIIGKIRESGRLLNYSRQVSIVFEMISSEHTKN
jgi:hypothetical protein